MTRISENIPATSEDLWRFSEDLWMLLKLSEDVPTTFELFWSYFKGKNFSVLWYSWPQIFSGKLNCAFVINHVLKNNLCGFVSQAWKVVLDAWDRCLRFAGVRLTHAWCMRVDRYKCIGLLPYMPYMEMATGLDMFFVLSVLHRVYNFVNVCPKQGI